MPFLSVSIFSFCLLITHSLTFLCFVSRLLWCRFPFQNLHLHHNASQHNRGQRYNPHDTSNSQKTRRWFKCCWTFFDELRNAIHRFSLSRSRSLKNSLLKPPTRMHTLYTQTYRILAKLQYCGPAVAGLTTWSFMETPEIQDGRRGYSYVSLSLSLFLPFNGPFLLRKRCFLDDRVTCCHVASTV